MPTKKCGVQLECLDETSQDAPDPRKPGQDQEATQEEATQEATQEATHPRKFRKMRPIPGNPAQNLTRSDPSPKFRDKTS